MQRFVAFLRGINVGGRTVTKDKLKEAFTSLGYRNVSTYKQSGNVIFETETANAPELEEKIQGRLLSMLGFEVPTFVRTIPQLKSIINLNPFKEQSPEGTSFLITFLKAALAQFPLQLPATIPKSTAQVIGASGTEVFSITHGGGEGALPNPFVETKLKAKATTRNLNVIQEIVQKYG